MIGTIALLSFRAAVNEKVLHLSALFGGLLIVAAVALGELGPMAGSKIFADFGLAAMSATAVLVAIVLAANDMPRELERRTLYVVLSKPVDRTSLVLGKFLGLLLALTILYVVMGAVFYLVMVATRLPMTPKFVVVMGFGLMEAAVVAGMAMVFSLLTSSTLASLYTLLLYLVGHQTGVIRSFGMKAEGLTRWMCEAMYRVLPNLEAFNLKNEVVYGVLPTSAQLLYAAGYGAMLMVALMGLSVLIFRGKEL